MRHLNQIIFVNSANIPYAEVMLDGNVHFSGTQGVGKSTILRALLFFYNADKMHLGIQSGQKSFEEFYFKNSNSYIVYEVRMDQNAYCILLSRSQGKVVYRFIDAPYRKAWLVGQDGRVESDWIKIREKIDERIDISAKIDTYEQYRNIIYGNTHDRSRKFDKYAIVESPKFQNIPRSIQNVFLNSKLDADFVKSTIIQSMTEGEVIINLSTYRHQVEDFEKEFDEIDCWYKKESNGEVLVRTKAQKVVDTYRSLVALDYGLCQTWKQLNYAVGRDREEMPLLEDKIAGLQASLKKIGEQLENEQTEYEKEHDQITKKIAEKDLRLKDVREKRKHYERLKISEMVALVSQEEKYLQEKEQKEEQLRKLQDNNRDIAEKYSSIYAALKDECKRFEIEQIAARNGRKEACLQEQEDERKIRDSRKKSIEDAHNEWIKASDNRMDVLNEDFRRADKRLSELQYWHPMSEEIESCRASIAESEAQKVELAGRHEIAKTELAAKRAELLLERERLKNDFDRRVEVADRELKQLQHELSETNRLLAGWSGSLYEWLSQNKPGWEENIGKVIDEKKVLYAQGLAPELCGEGSLFGVQLNLKAIPAHHRTPDDYRSLQKQLQDQVSAKKKEFADLQQEQVKAHELIRKRHNGIISDLQQTETNCDVRLAQVAQIIKDTETTLRQLEQKEREKIETERALRKQSFNDAQLGLEHEKQNRENEKTKFDKSLKSVESEYNAAVRALKKAYDDFCQNQKVESEACKNDIADRRRMIEIQERDELKGKGADTNIIELCKKDVEKVQGVLKEIAAKRHYVIEYRKDEVELLSHESEFRDEKRQLENRDAQLKQTYLDKRKRYEDGLAAHSLQLKESSGRLEAMKSDLKQYEQLCNVENVVPADLFANDSLQKTTDSCGQLIGQFRGTLNRKRQKNDELKQATNAFNSHFGANNTFHFAVPRCDEDYLEFALNLQDFIENNKIEDYRERVSEHYNNILKIVSREVGMLMNHSAEIRSVINELNRDFRERNFAGVIKNIEMRAEDSSDRMMQLLKSIRDFTEENELTMGEMNLFSGTDRDDVNQKVVEYLKGFMRQLRKESSRTELSLSDTFRMQFRIQENDNDTGWVERINNVGSDGTDILVKAMVNIMLINVFKSKASRKNGDFVIHCMMDEIGKLHPSNVSGILQFANVRNIYLINSSPMGYNADIYKYNYLLAKDGKSQTHVSRLVTING